MVTLLNGRREKIRRCRKRAGGMSKLLQEKRKVSQASCSVRSRSALLFGRAARGETFPLPITSIHILPMLTQAASGGVWFFIVKGGPVMIPIIILSVIALTIILAKFWELWRFRARLNKLSQKLGALIQDGNLSAALRTCREDTTSLGRLFESAVLSRSQERSELDRCLERLGGDVVADPESYMSALATVIGVEPMLGFLGTKKFCTDAWLRSWIWARTEGLNRLAIATQAK